MRLAKCSICQRVKMVNIVTNRGKHAGERCGDCFDAEPRDEAVRPAPVYLSSGPNHNDPGFDNVIRAVEEDR